MASLAEPSPSAEALDAFRVEARDWIAAQAPERAP